MNRFFKISFAAITMGFSLVTTADNACMPIAQACMQAGYYKDGHDVGKGLIKDCVQPIVSKSMTLPNTSFTDQVLQQCSAVIAAKMKQNQ